MNNVQDNVVPAKEVRKESYLILKREKELLFYGFLFKMFRNIALVFLVTSFIYPLASLQFDLFFEEYFSWYFNILFSHSVLFMSYVLFILFFFFVIISFFITVYEAAVIITVRGRVYGENPKFLGTLQKVWSMKHRILKSLLYRYLPNNQDLSSLWGGRRFFLQEFLFSDHDMLEIVKRGQDFERNYWWTSTKSRLRLFAPYFVMVVGLYLAPRFLISLWLGQNSQISLIHVLIIVSLLLVLYIVSVVVSLIEELISYIYNTLLHIYFLEQHHQFDDQVGFREFLRRVRERVAV